jgi:ribosomal protein S18 acetylase RimI-like enzyme
LEYLDFSQAIEYNQREFIILFHAGIAGRKAMVKLAPMGETDFRAFLEKEIYEYAQEKVRAGAWDQEKAYDLSVQAHNRLLPEGLATHDHYLFSILDENLGEKVGVIWFARLEDSGKQFAFIYDLVVFEQFRQRGYGTQAMLALEGKVKEVGLDTIMLHVFGHNQIAQALYKKVGYETTDIMMAKPLKDGEASFYSMR